MTLHDSLYEARRFLVEVYKAAHLPELENTLPVYFLCSDGSIHRQHPHSSRYEEVAPPASWDIGTLETILPPNGDKPARTAIVTSQRVAIRLRKFTSILLSEGI